MPPPGGKRDACGPRRGKLDTIFFHTDKTETYQLGQVREVLGELCPRFPKRTVQSIV